MRKTKQNTQTSIRKVIYTETLKNDLKKMHASLQLQIQGWASNHVEKKMLVPLETHFEVTQITSQTARHVQQCSNG